MGDKLKSKKIQLELSQHVWRSLEMNHKKIILEKKRLNSSLPAIQAFFFFLLLHLMFIQLTGQQAALAALVTFFFATLRARML